MKHKEETKLIEYAKIKIKDLNQQQWHIIYSTMQYQYDYCIIDGILWRFLGTNTTWLHKHTYFSFKRITEEGNIERLRIYEFEAMTKDCLVINWHGATVKSYI